MIKDIIYKEAQKMVVIDNAIIEIRKSLNIVNCNVYIAFSFLITILYIEIVVTRLYQSI